AYTIIVQLRPHLDEAEFLRSVERQSHSGYELVGAFRAGALVGVLGMRPVHTLARGPHLHIDDLVTDEAARRAGFGRALMGFCRSGGPSAGHGRHPSRWASGRD